MRTLILPLLIAATSASAQDTKTPPQTKTPAATAGQTRMPAATAGQTRPQPPATKQDAKTAPAAGTKAAAPANTQNTKAPAGQQRGVTVAPATPATAQRPPQIMRETFDYSSGGRRDPFNSLIASTELRPTIADLRLVGVLYHPTRPIASMLDVSTNTQYRVTLGTTLGRMRVALIKPKVVIFSIEEFGLNRQDSLVLGDTTKVRAR